MVASLIVSFWLQGQYGSFAAAPSQPGWSFENTFYHATAAADVGGGTPPPTRSGAACSGKKSPDAINRPLTRIRHVDSRHRNRNAQYLVGPSSKDFQALSRQPSLNRADDILPL
jgi:hypothetical protein